jgi:hypothetical protein
MTCIADIPRFYIKKDRRSGLKRLIRRGTYLPYGLQPPENQSLYE